MISYRIRLRLVACARSANQKSDVGSQGEKRGEQTVERGAVRFPTRLEWGELVLLTVANTTAFGGAAGLLLGFICFPWIKKEEEETTTTTG